MCDLITINITIFALLWCCLKTGCIGTGWSFCNSIFYSDIDFASRSPGSGALAKSPSQVAKEFARRFTAVKANRLVILQGNLCISQDHTSKLIVEDEVLLISIQLPYVQTKMHFLNIPCMIEYPLQVQYNYIP